MEKKLNAKVILTALLLMATLNFGAFTKPAPNQAPARIDCSKATEADLVEAIYEKIKVKYAGQMNHINVRFKAGVVTLEGWVTTKAAKKEIEGFAKKTKCIKKVENKLGTAAGAGCGPGQKQCGDICIPSTETCNIRVR